MAKRILTAREQYELLTPWQKHAVTEQYSLGAQEDAVAANKLIPSQWQELMKAPGTMRLPVGVEADDTKPSGDHSCAKCKGSGRANFGVCNKCFGSGTATETDFGSANEVLEGWSKDQENKDPSGLRASDAEPWGNKLEQALYKEFMEDWWPNSKAAEERLPLLKEDKIPTNWRDYPNEPITHWLNVEDFLQERYPEGHTGSSYGFEEALPLLNKISQPGNISPEWLDKNGYVGTGNVVTQAMLNLHNKLQGRKWLNDDMRRQYYQLMLKHVGPGARRLSRLLRTAGPAQETLSEWTSTRDKNFGDQVPSVYGVLCPTCSGKGCRGCGFIGRVFSQDFQPKENLIKDTVKPWANKLEQGLYEEFMDWWPESEANKTRSPDTVNTGWSRFPKEPLTHWLNVEDFLQERYPDAATGAKLGLEEAKPLLKRNIENNLMSPEEMEQHGYVGHGNVVTQAMLNLHNKLQGRTYDNLHDQRRYFELMLRHIGPGARQASRFWKVGYDPRKVVWNPEEKALAAELQSRLDYGWESGNLPRLDPDSPEHFTQALQEMIQMNKEREQRSDADSLDLGYDPAYNDFEAGYESGDFDKQASRYSYFDDTPYWAAAWDGWEDDDDDDELRPKESRRFWAMAPAEDAYDENLNAYHSSPESKAVRRNDFGKWYHVSPHKLDAGTVLKPGGGESPYGEDHSMPDERRDWVWMDGPEGLKTWYYGTLLGQVKKGVENPWAYIYEVEPSEGPHPWNGTGWEGHAAPSAKIVREIETDKYNRLPDHLGHIKTAIELNDEDGQKLQRQSESFAYRIAFQYELPQGISVTGHPFRKSKGLADEVLDQNGPAILWKALKDRWPGDHHYVARGEDGTIHGVLKGHWGKDRFNVSDLYSSIKAPSGTGNHLLRTVAQEAMSQGKGLRVINMLNDARPYWEGMGAQTEYNNAHASWSPEGLQALVNGDTIMSPNTEGTMMHNQPIPREHRLPGSAREIAWGRRRLPRSAGKGGDLPEGISFSHGKMFDGRDAVQAHIGDTLVGQLQWNSAAGKRGFTNDINYITVHPEYRRRGIGTGMYNYAVQNVDPELLPGSTDVTPSGKAFSKSLGFNPADHGSYMDGTPWGFDLDPVRDDGNDWPDAAIGNGWQWDEKFNYRSKDRFAFWHAKPQAPLQN